MSNWLLIMQDRRTWPPDNQDIILTYEISGVRKFKTSRRNSDMEEPGDYYPNIPGANWKTTKYYWISSIINSGAIDRYKQMKDDLMVRMEE